MDINTIINIVVIVIVAIINIWIIIAYLKKTIKFSQVIEKTNQEIINKLGDTIKNIRESDCNFFKQENDILSKKVDSLNKEIDSARIGKQLYDDISTLREYGVIRIFPNRNEFYFKVLVPYINDFINEKEKIFELNLIGISLREFFKSEQKDKFLLDIKNILTKNNVNIKALIIDKGSDLAWIRIQSDLHPTILNENDKIEEDYQLKIDVKEAIKYYHEFNKQNINKNVNFKLKLYKDVPFTCFLAIFKNIVAVEQYYHGGLGGIMPVILMKKDSILGKSFNTHFQFTWDRSGHP